MERDAAQAARHVIIDVEGRFRISYDAFMTSREDILERVRRQHVANVLHPGRFTQGIVYDDPAAQFQTVLETVGGRFAAVSTAEAATVLLESLSEYASASKTFSMVPGVGRSTFDLDTVADPHELDDVDFTVLPGELAVAENAAVWVTTPDVRLRTLYFLTQHLALVVPRNRVVSNMHQAYECIDVAKHAFGTWLSGPSKTADIEQSLVKGAHGARTLFVMLTGE